MRKTCHELIRRGRRWIESGFRAGIPGVGERGEEGSATSRRRKEDVRACKKANVVEGCPISFSAPEVGVVVPGTGEQNALKKLFDSVMYSSRGTRILP